MTLNPTRLKRLLFLLCITFSVSVFSQTIIDSEDFEVEADGKWGIWNDGGNKCKRDPGSKINAAPDKHSIELKKNDGGTKASMTTDDIDLTGYTSIDFSFYYVSKDMEGTDDFLLRYSDDGGSNWVTIKSFVVGTDFNNGTIYSGSESIDTGSYTFSTNSQFRITCDSNDDNDKVYIDNILIEGVPIPTPIIDLVGNSTTLTNEQTAISITDDTDFGSVNPSSGSETHIFTIENNGDLDLTSISVSLTSGSPEFTLDTSATTAIVSASGSTTFSITFTPTDYGTTYSGAVSITSNDSDRDPYTFNIEGEGLSYCASYGDTDYDTGITLVDFNTISNASDLPTNDYSDFTSISTTLEQSSTHNLTVNLNTDDDAWGPYVVLAMVWIDWNQDGVFNSTDEEYDLGYAYNTDDGPTTASALSITVPSGASLGNTRMRVSAKYDGVEYSDGTPAIISHTSCEEDFDGEVEDYTINVIAGTPAPIISVTGNSITIADNDVTPSTTDDTDFDSLNPDTDSVTHIFTIENNGTADLNTISISFSGDSDFTLDTSSTATSVSSGGTTTFAITFDPSAEATYSGVVSITSNDSDRSPYTFNIIGKGSFYCESSGISGFGGIAGVDFADITISGSGITDSYKDYSDTAYTTEITQSSSNDITININTGGHNTLGVVVWIDWNQDYDFDDESEYYDLGSVHNTTSDLTLSITTPAWAPLGDTRMRISAKRRGEHDTTDEPEQTSCETGFNGEVEDYKVTVVAGIQKIDFDGTDDYINFGDSHDLTGNFTIEAWILQESTVSNGTIISKGDIESLDSKSYGYFLSVQNDFLNLTTYNTGGNEKINATSSYAISNNIWFHVVATFDGSTVKLYVDGLEVASESTSGALSNRSESFLIGAAYDSDTPTVPKNYFNGFIDEVRLWNVALSETQIREMMNQEIEKNGTAVKGKSIPRDISGGLLWDDLNGYYNMNSDNAYDDTDNSIDGFTVNITTSEVQSAPIPYSTDQDGDWDDSTGATPWTYGDSVWGIPNSLGVDGTTDIDWNIVRTSHNIDVERSLKVLGLISESTALIDDEEITDSELTMGSDGNDYELNISWYLKLDGKIDLQNESQLIQGDYSWLDEDSSGYVERDQQGSANSFTYNYWSSPVGKRDISSNNVAHKSGDILRDGHAAQDVIGLLDFDPDSSSSIDPYYADGTAGDPRKLATYWMWTFSGSQDNEYSSWTWVGNYDNINVTEGFTMKGTSGSGGVFDSENYVFRGKPNNVLNGDTEIVHTSFTAALGGNEYPKVSLTGNPFPSAMDATKFINDNSSSIDGQLYFWQHWGGNTHKWALYQGGYAIRNLATGVPAVSHPSVSQTDDRTNSQKIEPTQYIPVAQGFYVIQKNDYDSGTETYSNLGSGDVVFKNSQRIFKTEGSGESVFTKGSSKKESINKVTEEGREIIRLGFTSPTGFYRQVATVFIDGATDELDYGYDAIAGDYLKNDAFFIQDNKYLVIQSFGEFDASREIPISIFIDEESEGGIQKIEVTDIENFDANIQVYIKDNHNNGDTFEISSNVFEVQLEPGEHKDRFSLVFQSKLETLSDGEVLEDGVHIFMNNSLKSLIVTKKADLEFEQVLLYNSLGQQIMVWNKGLREREIQLPIQRMTTGVYVVKIKTKQGLISKKVIIE